MKGKFRKLEVWQEAMSLVVQQNQFEELDGQAARVAARLYGLKKYLSSQIE